MSFTRAGLNVPRAVTSHSLSKSLNPPHQMTNWFQLTWVWLTSLRFYVSRRLSAEAVAQQYAGGLHARCRLRLASDAWYLKTGSGREFARRRFRQSTQRP